MKLKGTIILSLISLFERLSYYGVRAILIIYVTDPNSLNIDSNATIKYYGYWTSILVFIAIPFSLVTDKYLGQRKSIYVGGVISLLGYLILLIQSKYAVLLSLILILIGTSLVKPSTTILVGRQFTKENKKRTLAYMIFFMGINLGAFLGILGIGYVGEVYAWKFGFIIAAISTLVYLSIAYFLKSQIREIETNDLLDSNHEITLSRTILIIPLLVLIHIVFWKSYELEISELNNYLINTEDKIFFGYELLDSMLQSFSSFWTLPLTIVVFIYWYNKKVTDVFKSICFSLLLLIVAIVATFALRNIEISNILELSMIPLGIYAFAEVIISPILTSYVTRISDVKYSNTIYSVFIFLTYVIGAGFVYILQNDYQTYVILTILVLSILGMIFYKNQIRKLTYELK